MCFFTHDYWVSGSFGLFASHNSVSVEMADLFGMVITLSFLLCLYNTHTHNSMPQDLVLLLLEAFYNSDCWFLKKGWMTKGGTDVSADTICRCTFQQQNMLRFHLLFSGYLQFTSLTSYKEVIETNHHEECLTFHYVFSAVGVWIFRHLMN